MPFSFLSKNKKEYKKEDKEEHIIELYNHSNSLPVNGWIQQCKNCDIRTSKTIEFKRVDTSKTKYMVYLCKDCNRKKVIKDEEFINKLNKHIELNYLFTS